MSVYFLRQVLISQSASRTNGACRRLRPKHPGWCGAPCFMNGRESGPGPRWSDWGSSIIKAYDGQRVGAKAARVSKVRPGGNTPTLTGGPATEEIHPQQEHGARTAASLALPSAASAPLHRDTHASAPATVPNRCKNAVADRHRPSAGSLEETSKTNLPRLNSQARFD